MVFQHNSPRTRHSDVTSKPFETLRQMKSPPEGTPGPAAEPPSVTVPLRTCAGSNDDDGSTASLSGGSKKVAGEKEDDEKLGPGIRRLRESERILQQSNAKLQVGLGVEWKFWRFCQRGVPTSGFAAPIVGRHTIDLATHRLGSRNDYHSTICRTEMLLLQHFACIWFMRRVRCIERTPRESCVKTVERITCTSKATPRALRPKTRRLLPADLLSSTLKTFEKTRMIGRYEGCESGRQHSNL